MARSVESLTFPEKAALDSFVKDLHKDGCCVVGDQTARVVMPMSENSEDNDFWLHTLSALQKTAPETRVSHQILSNSVAFDMTRATFDQLKQTFPNTAMEIK